MGMFDRVWVRCPDCASPVEFQSKAGDCLLRGYTVDNAPTEVINDLVGAWEFCEDCRSSVIFPAKTTTAHLSDRLLSVLNAAITLYGEEGVIRRLRG